MKPVTVSSRLLPRLAAMASAASLATLLAACATAPVVPQKPPAAPTLAQLLTEADAVAKGGQYDQAATMLQRTSAAYPADKAPWLQLAQMAFDRGQYGQAIVQSQQALERDPEDKVASSIIAVSGLRLSSKALADLSRQNNLNGSVRSEAQELARLLRAALGEEVLVPPNKRPAAAPRRGAANAGANATANPAPAAKGGNAADPFSGLK